MSNVGETTKLWPQDGRQIFTLFDSSLVQQMALKNFLAREIKYTRKTEKSVFVTIPIIESFRVEMHQGMVA